MRIIGNDGEKIRLGRAYTVKYANRSKLNVTYDMWVSDNRALQNENPLAEIMIWLHRVGEITQTGTFLQSIEIGGASWHLRKGPHPVSGWPVYSFVREKNAKSASLNFAAFFNVLENFGLNGSDYLLRVEAGAEIFTGAGSLRTKKHSLKIKAGRGATRAGFRRT